MRERGGGGGSGGEGEGGKQAKEARRWRQRETTPGGSSCSTFLFLEIEISSGDSGVSFCFLLSFRTFSACLAIPPPPPLAAAATTPQFVRAARGGGSIRVGQGRQSKEPRRNLSRPEKGEETRFCFRPWARVALFFSSFPLCRRSGAKREEEIKGKKEREACA